jgi:hypothetical protein
MGIGATAGNSPLHGLSVICTLGGEGHQQIFTLLTISGAEDEKK